jgi:hypothetical protein
MVNNCFHSLNEDLLVTILTNLDSSTACSLVRTDKKWREIDRTHQEFLWRNRVQIQYGNMLLPPNTATWKEFCQQLYFGHGDYVGFALDEHTADFQPYPMRFQNHATTHPIAGSTWIQWHTLGNAITRVRTEDHKIKRRSNCDLRTTLSFVEVELIQGDQIHIPVEYKGVCCGPFIVGHYLSLQGAFFLCHKYFDSLTSIIIQKGLQFAGFLIAREHHYAVDLEIGNEVNINSSTLLEIPDDWDRTSIKTLFNGKMNLLHTSTLWGRHWPTWFNDKQEKCIDTEVLMAFLKPRHGQCEVKLKINSMRESSNDSSGSAMFARFMASSTGSCCVKGDFLVGLLKSPYVTGCFVLQLKRQGKSSLLALRKMKECSHHVD